MDHKILDLSSIAKMLASDIHYVEWKHDQNQTQNQVASNMS